MIPLKKDFLTVEYHMILKPIMKKEFKVSGGITVIKLFPYSCTYLCEQGSSALRSIRRKS